MPVKTTRSMNFFGTAPEAPIYNRVPRGTRAVVVGEVKFTGSGWKVLVELVDVRDESGYQIEDLMGRRGRIEVDVDEYGFWGLEPLEDRWQRSLPPVSRQDLPRSQRSWMKPNPVYRWETLADVDGTNANDSYATLHSGMQSWNPNEWETTGLAFDEDGEELGEERVSFIRQQHQFRVHGAQRNPEKHLNIEVGDTLELERHPVYDHGGEVPRYKVTRRKVKTIEWLPDGRGILTLIGVKSRYVGGWYDKYFQLTGSEERGHWLSSDKPGPTRYAILKVIKKKRRVRKKRR